MAAHKGHAKTGGRKKGVPNKTTAVLKAAFQKHQSALVKALVALTKSKDERVRLGAIEACLNRGWGGAAQSVTDEDGGPVRHVVTIIDPTRDS